jgi:hypothetical protein
MAILVNWFEVTFDRKEFTLPFLSCATWDESTPILRQYPEARIVRSRQQDGTIRLYFITGTPVVDHSTEAVPSAGMMSVAARLIESNLGKYFEDQGTRVSSSHWGTEITREVQSFSPIGLTIQQGIHAKYFADLEPKFRHGITLNWIVRPIFTLSIADLPATKNYDGLPVLLRWPESLGPCPNELAPPPATTLLYATKPTKSSTVGRSI